MHRYLMVLHTDEPHPHVHMLIKAVSEQGERLNIRKATLRGWRREFAQHLRALGVPTNATERAVRGQNQSPKRDGIYRSEQRGESRRVSTRTEEVRRDLVLGRLRAEPGKQTLIDTRKEVERGWWEVSEILLAQGQQKLGAEVKRFICEMPPLKTDQEVMAEKLRKRFRAEARESPSR